MVQIPELFNFRDDHMPLKQTLADLSDALRPYVDEIDTDELAQAAPHTLTLPAHWQPAEGEPLVIDVREADERARGYVPGSLHIARGVLERDIAKKAFGGRISDKELNQPIVCYCGGGHRSLLAARNLQLMGFTNVVSLEGGFDAWGEAGLPVAHERG